MCVYTVVVIYSVTVCVLLLSRLEASVTKTNSLETYLAISVSASDIQHSFSGLLVKMMASFI